MKLRYNTSGNWFKGNTHIHSTASDGGKDFIELAELYAAAGYDFLFRTDHWVCSDTQSDMTSYPLLWLDGIELDGNDGTGAGFHVVCLGELEGISREDGFEAGLQSAKEQGAITILAHPHWCGNSLDDARRWNFDGVEVYNNVCHWLNGKSGGKVHWDAMLMQDTSTLALSVDDAHLRSQHPDWHCNGGWIVVNAIECTKSAVFEAIRQGNFYASCGPAFNSIALDGDHLQVETSPIKMARLVGPKSNGMQFGNRDGEPIQTLRFSIPESWKCAYLEIEDTQGRRAWTNALFIEEESPHK